MPREVWSLTPPRQSGAESPVPSRLACTAPVILDQKSKIYNRKPLLRQPYGLRFCTAGIVRNFASTSSDTRPSRCTTAPPACVKCIAVRYIAKV